MPEQKDICHKYGTGKIIYPTLSLRHITIPWSNIDFISTTPSVNLINGRWQTYNGKFLDDKNSSELLDFFHIAVALKNRQLVTTQLTIWQRIFFWLYFPLVKALFDANDKPEKEKGIIEYEVKKQTLNCELKYLLDFINKKSSFGLICSF